MKAKRGTNSLYSYHMDGAKSPPRRRREASLMFQVIDARHYKNVRAVVYINLDDDSNYIKRNFTF